MSARTFGMSDRMLSQASDLTDEELFGKSQVAMHTLWETLHRMAWDLCINPGPRLLDKLIILHEITKPEYRVEPWDAAPALDRFLSEHPGDLTFVNVVGAARAAFVSYAEVTHPRREKRAPKMKEKVGVNISSVSGEDRF
jgi:hypothetical protein